MMRVYLFDLDGTLADMSHRLHHIKDPMGEPGSRKAPPPGVAEPEFKEDWDAFYAACVDDTPIEHMVDLIDILANENTIVYITGRSDQCRDATVDWLEKHDLPPGQLFMRRAGDHRPDHVVKGELVDQVIACGLKPTLAFEDRSQVVKMLRARGIPCAQVAEGDF